MPFSPGSRLGNYEIVSPLGFGGMGEVYRARDLRLGREVALKILPEKVAGDASRLARFEQEARTVASLNHANIVTLFSVEDEGDTRFLTMELVEGKSLDQHLKAGELSIEHVVELGIALAEALAAAHDKGVVHRDLKPANVMLSTEGQLKVLDFGLAKLEDPESGADPTQAETIAAPLSDVGQVLGTVPYMAPEQVSGASVDNRTDLFALGVVLYELTSGQRPFVGATPGVLSSAILRDTPPPLSNLRRDIPADLERIIARCLAKEPRARFQSALDVANELRHMGQSRAPAATIIKMPPVPATPLLGREELLRIAAERLDSGVRVLTVTGYGGTGKTRFSTELFRRLAPRYDGGAAFVSLAAVTKAAEVLPTVALALEIAEAHGRTALDALGTFVGERPVLLLLDNLEQVLAAAEDIAELVARCPGLQVIATSRAPLKIGAEAEFDLPPLDLPETDNRSVESLQSCPSVALLVQRAEKVKSGFSLTPQNAEAVAAICRRLDGLPLALELAAARIRILEPAALLQRLDHALDLLTSGDRDLPLRQRTLRATISWSYSLLEPREQELLRAVSVFHEGWTLEAMERVCYTADESLRALDELDSLVEKGLVRVVGAGERYTLLETIRAFSAEQLHASGRVETVRNAHADYCLDFAETIWHDLHGVGQLAAMHRGRNENANMLAAIQWLTSSARMDEQSALEKGLLMCGCLNWFWHIGGQHYTARALLDPLLAMAEGLPPSRGRALAALGAAMVSTTTGEWERSLQESILGYEEASSVGDREVAAEGTMFVGYCCLSLQRLEESRNALDKAIELSSNGVSDFFYALSLSLKGMLLFASGELAEGMALVEQALPIQERLQDLEGGGVTKSFKAQMVFAQGDHARALAIYGEALDSLETVGDRPEVARVHCEMGWTALAATDAGVANQCFRSAVETYEEVGSPRGTGLALLGLAAVAAAEGHTERALKIAASAQALTERAGVVVDHPMDPGVVSRIEALKASIPEQTVDGLLAKASTLAPAEVLAMLDEAGG